MFGPDGAVLSADRGAAGPASSSRAAGFKYAAWDGIGTRPRPAGRARRARSKLCLRRRQRRDRSRGRRSASSSTATAGPAGRSGRNLLRQLGCEVVAVRLRRRRASSPTRPSRSPPTSTDVGPQVVQVGGRRRVRPRPGRRPAGADRRDRHVRLRGTDAGPGGEVPARGRSGAGGHQHVHVAGGRGHRPRGRVRVPAGRRSARRTWSAGMRAAGAVIGGEGNGGVIDPRVGWVRDPFVGMAMILTSWPRTGKPLSRAGRRAARRTRCSRPSTRCRRTKLAGGAGRHREALAGREGEPRRTACGSTGPDRGCTSGRATPSRWSG